MSDSFRRSIKSGFRSYGEYEQEAAKNIAEAQNQIKGRSPEKQLEANIEAGVTTIEACRGFCKCSLRGV